MHKTNKAEPWMIQGLTFLLKDDYPSLSNYEAERVAFSMCQDSTEKISAPWMTEGGTQREEAPVVEEEEDKALGDEMGDQDDLRLREAAEVAEAGGEIDDLTEHAVNIVAEAIMRAKKGQKLNMTPEQASARAKKAWETRKKNQQAKPDPAAGAGTAVAEEEPTAPSVPLAEEPAEPVAEAPAEAPAGAPAAPPPAAPGGGTLDDALSQTSAAGEFVGSGDLGQAASAADGMIQAITSVRDAAQGEGDTEAAEGLTDLLSQISGVSAGLKQLAEQGGVDEATQGQIKQTFDQIGARLSELSGAGAEAPAAEMPPMPEMPAEEPAPEMPAEEPAAPVAPAAPAAPPVAEGPAPEPPAEEAPPEPIDPSEVAPAAPEEAAPTVDPGAEAPVPPPAEAPVDPAAADPAAADPAAADPAAVDPAVAAQPQAGGHKKGKVSEMSVAKVKGVMSRNGLSSQSEEMGELASFKGTLGMRGRGRTVEQLKADFIQNMNPSNYESSEALASAKQRMQATPAKDFAMILAAIHEDEDALGEAPAAGAAPAPVTASLASPQEYRSDAATLVRAAFDRVLEAAK